MLFREEEGCDRVEISLYILINSEAYDVVVDIVGVFFSAFSSRHSTTSHNAAPHLPLLMIHLSPIANNLGVVTELLFPS